MNRFAFALFLGLLTCSLGAQTPQSRLSYEDRSGTTGHTLTIDGKAFGPYKTVDSILYSTSGTAGLFLVTKREKTYALAQGKEWGPLAQGFEAEESWVSDDGKVWAVSAGRELDSLETDAEDLEDLVSEVQLWVNGKVYGPYTSVESFQYSETGGRWIAVTQNQEGTFEVLVDGKAQGAFDSVDHSWVSLDGQFWGWASSDANGVARVVTQNRTYERLAWVNFDQMDPRAPHWAYGLRIDDEQELVVVDGQEYRGYLNFEGLQMTWSGRHWGFAAEKLTDTGDYPVVVIDGKEYVGEGLDPSHLGATELFTWTVSEGNKVTVQVLPLP